MQTVARHVIKGAFKAADLSDGLELRTIRNEIITVHVTGATITFTAPDGGSVGTVTLADLMSCEGVIHVIDAVLIPGGESGDSPASGGDGPVPIDDGGVPVPDEDGDFPVPIDDGGVPVPDDDGDFPVPVDDVPVPIGGGDGSDGFVPAPSVRPPPPPPPPHLSNAPVPL